MAKTMHRRIRHAAHYYGGGGHDLEQWDVIGPKGDRGQRPPDVPSDAEYHSGYLQDGVQHWIYVRRAPLSVGTCGFCQKGSAQ